MVREDSFIDQLLKHCRTVLAKGFGRERPGRSRGQALLEIERKFSYRFRDWTLLDQALTHKSYANEMLKDKDRHYERLEFLGDSVLNVVVSHLLMDKYADFDEGELSRHRSALVNDKSLAQIAQQLDLGKYFLLGKGEERTQGRSKHSILANVYEAILGAVYLDGGYQNAFAVVRSHFEPLLEPRKRRAVGSRDFKSHLQEYVQGAYKTIPAYNLIKESGPDHAKEFEVNIQINGQVCGSGRGKSKKEAEQRAAAESLKRINPEAYLSFFQKIRNP